MRRLRYGLRRIWYIGRRVECPCCGALSRRFAPHRGRPDAHCRVCDSAERHRTLALFLRRETGLFSERARVLHFAPERSIGRPLSARSNIDYLSGDINPQAAMKVMDITAITEPDESFDVVLCNHVLEHIPDDAAAMRELRRVLRPGGVAYMQHPVDASRAATYEDAAITAPADRMRAFEQEDHVRIYGRDFTDRLEQAGFTVEVRAYDREVSAGEARRYGLKPGLRGSDVYVARKR